MFSSCHSRCNSTFFLEAFNRGKSSLDLDDEGWGDQTLVVAGTADGNEASQPAGSDANSKKRQKKLVATWCCGMCEQTPKDCRDPFKQFFPYEFIWKHEGSRISSSNFYVDFQLFWLGWASCGLVWALTGFGSMDGHLSYEFIGFGSMAGHLIHMVWVYGWSLVI